jgi:hypothetical protein
MSYYNNGYQNPNIGQDPWPFINSTMESIENKLPPSDSSYVGTQHYHNTVDSVAGAPVISVGGAGGKLVNMPFLTPSKVLALDSGRNIITTDGVQGATGVAGGAGSQGATGVAGAVVSANYVPVVNPGGTAYIDSPLTVGGPDTSVSGGLAMGENQILSFGVPAPGYPNAYIQYNSNQLELHGRGGLMFPNYTGGGTGGYLRVDDGAIVHDDGILTNGLHGFVSVDATAVRLGDSVPGMYPLEVKMPTSDIKFLDASGFDTGGMPATNAGGWIRIQVLTPNCGYEQMYIPLYYNVTP